ncbi:cyclin-I isoform X1 [Kryptolebias marmoratus]|uniref:cyclin-I isoform X1 n=1 Tax=Kryptolebias marmoratus TaxID=37003 RepID=UPI0018ACAA76|nr:cyclin-I isoform X1 [Kryptolebias marmoratus]
MVAGGRFYVERTRCVCPGCSLACAVELMKNPEDPESRRLIGLLEAALLREARLWKVPVFKHERIQGTDISSVQHQQVILWLGEMSRMFQFCPETYALGVCVLNRLLSTVKAQTKYLKCIAFTSLVLAAKVNEEDEVLGSVKDLVVRSGCNFSTAEILRMERIILDKLHWDLYTATPVDFIHIFHALLVSGHPHLDPSICPGSGVKCATGPRALPADPGHQKRPLGFQVSLWTRQVQHCMACHQLWQFKGSTLALAIITLELEALTPDWFSVFTDLLKKAHVNSAEFIHCKEIVDEYLHSLEFALPTNSVYILDGSQIQQQVWSPALRRGLARRGRSSNEQGDADDYSDGFRRLYSEENDMECLFGSERKGVSPCPPLHPAVN